MKTLLIFPPIWHPVAPHLAIPSLMGQLEKEGVDVEALDINVEFYNDLLKKSYLDKTIKELNKVAEETKTKANDIDKEEFENLSFENKELILKNDSIQKYLNKKSHQLKIVPKEIKKAISIIRSKKEFYKPESYIRAMRTISAALEIISLPYAPARIALYGYQNPLFEMDYESIKNIVFSHSTNIFAEYYKKWIPKILKKKPNLIGISVGSKNQIIPALTLANLLKKHTDAHITIGGNYFSRTKGSFLNYPDFFDTFADSVLYNEGEIPITELAKRIEQNLPIDDISNLIYKKDDKVIINEVCKPLRLNQIPKPSYKGYDFSKYLTPEIVLLLETNRGCYWGKCAFCDIPYGKEYSSKNVDDLISEIKEYKKKYGVSNFELVDESIPPKYYEQFAEKIIESKLNINYYSCARTEAGFTKEILHKLRKSGLRMVLWGIEAGSERVMKVLNKGVDFDNRFQILQDAADEDIWNHGYAFFGFPTETFDEALETVNTLEKHSKIIHSCGITFFELTKNSNVEKEPEKYGLSYIGPKNTDFRNILEYKGNTLSEEEKEKIKQKCEHTLGKFFEVPIFNNVPTTEEYVFLYLAKYGTNTLKTYKLKS